MAPVARRAGDKEEGSGWLPRQEERPAAVGEAAGGSHGEKGRRQGGGPRVVPAARKDSGDDEHGLGGNLG